MTLRRTPVRQWSVSHELPGDERACGVARQFVTSSLARSTQRDLLDAALLAVTELASNALRHGRPPFRVGVSLDDDQVQVHVSDADPHCPQARRAGAHADPLAESGRGLEIVQALVQHWGCRHRPDGKEIWFELGEPAALPAG
ncbi:ATP-binding protein [Motilibacter rhizosphaerae]|uniref:ATP-binding protein n=1 Tax=Motilibacter rhizosphaerae TaxID=598652 RepID=UPI0013EE96F9|nr:ATP-binding protein [Motilibacter rhizosphaerae]